MAGRTLEFMADMQRLRKKPDCDFTGLVAGSVGYLKAKFYFSQEWRGCTKVVSFWFGEDGQVSLVLDKDNSCIIPSEALKENAFYVSVLGGKPAYRLKTNKIKVRQEVN